MCGIAGIYTRSHTREEITELILAMRDRLRHRGPNDAGAIVSELPGGWAVGLGHTRLSVQDITAAGSQPMRRGELSLAFNGEIYNFQPLRRELEAEGYAFSSRTDTEVLLQAFAHWGADCFARFNGMWALAILNHTTGEIFLSRDRLGIKPLYYAWLGETLLFGSEPKALLAYPRLAPELDRSGLLDYLSYRYVLGTGTMFRQICALAPGHHLRFGGNTGRAESQRYWELPVYHERPDPGPAAVLDESRALLTEAVRLRMISDVPTGAYLSGGLDSSVLVALMSRQTTTPVKTFTIGFEEPGFNELDWAREASVALGTDHHELTMSARDYLRLIPRAIEYKDAPLSVPNEVPLLALSEALARQITVVLSGEGADELFAGYGRIFRSALDFERLTELHRPGAAALPELAGNLAAKYPGPVTGDALDHFLRQYTYLSADDKRRVLSAQALPAGEVDWLNRGYFEPIFARTEGLDLHDRYIYLFQRDHLPGLLYRLDTTTMAHGVEARVPFVDHLLIERISALPLKYRLGWRSDEDRRAAAGLNSDQMSETHDIPKVLLRQIAADLLPARIIQRRKVGFPVPLAQWFAQQYTDPCRELLLAPDSRTRPLLNLEVVRRWLEAGLESGRNSHGLGLWMLLNLEIWLRQYDVAL